MFANPLIPLGYFHVPRVSIIQVHQINGLPVLRVPDPFESGARTKRPVNRSGHDETKEMAMRNRDE